MPGLREALAEDLGMHATSNTHPGRCLCGTWKSGTWGEHLADSVLAIITERWGA